MNWDSPQLRRLIALALDEDHGTADVTTQTLIGATWRVTAQVRAKQAGVMAGLPLAARLFRALDRALQVRLLVKDGTPVRAGDGLLEIRGRARSVLAAERPALNALQHLSGIATYTAEQVRRMGKGGSQLFDTRKTIPGWRVLEKYAVKCGGGQNHRMHLADAVLVKENHIGICRQTGFDWVRAIQALRRGRPSFPVQIEIQNDRDLRDAVAARPQRVLLDNMAPARLRRVIRRLRRSLPGVEIEISGGVRPEQLRGLARLGAERISMGRLTHSAPAFDCSLDFLSVKPR